MSGATRQPKRSGGSQSSAIRGYIGVIEGYGKEHGNYYCIIGYITHCNIGIMKTTQPHLAGVGPLHPELLWGDLEAAATWDKHRNQDTMSHNKAILELSIRIAVLLIVLKLIMAITTDTMSRSYSYKHQFCLFFVDKPSHPEP